MLQVGSRLMWQRVLTDLKSNGMTKAIYYLLVLRFNKGLPRQVRGLLSALTSKIKDYLCPRILQSENLTPHVQTLGKLLVYLCLGTPSVTLQGPALGLKLGL